MAALTDRIDRIEADLRSLERELAEVRRLAATHEQPEPEPVHVPPAPSLLPDDFDWAQEEPAVVTPSVSPPPRVVREIDWASLLFDARTLAWTGGVVTLLGIAFFFVLAAERGWIGPVARVSLGAAASAIVFAASLELRRRFGDTYASLSAAGAGIAGAYLTLLAAVALYHLLPEWSAMGIAALIAAAAAAIALRWDAQTLAALGLLGALLAPVALAAQDHLNVVGGAFAAFVLLPATAIAVARRWRALQVAALAVTAPHVLALAFEHRHWTLPVAIACAVAYGGGGLALTLRDGLSRLSASLLLTSAVFMGGCVALLYAGVTEGVGLAIVAAAYTAVSVGLYRRDRDAATVLWAIGLAAGGVAAADLASGATLTIVWAGEASVVAFLAHRLRDRRVEIGALAWLTLAIGHAVIVDARPTLLFVENTRTLHAVPSALALAIAAAAIAACTSDRRVRLGMSILTLAAGLFTGSLALLAAAPSWDWGHVAVVGLWSGTAVVLVFRFPFAALSLIGATTVLAGGYDLYFVDAPQRWWSGAVLAVAALAVAAVHELRLDRRYEAYGALAVSAGFAAGAAAGLLDGKPVGVALLAIGVVYGAVAVSLARRRRDFATAVGAVAIAFAIAASVILLSGTWLVLAWTIASIGLTVAARLERRLEVGSLVLIGFAAVHALAFEALPTHLFVAQRHPAAGALSVLLVAGATAMFARVQGRAIWGAALAVLYAASLGVLGLAEAAGGDVATEFQRGHTAVSALWGALGLALLVVGLKRRSERRLQVAGFALFGVALAKLFVYDLAHLSSITRALSFLAVGAVMIAAGFVYQRVATNTP